MTDYFNTGLAQTDPVIDQALCAELDRQRNQIELIASENIVSRAVLDALGHEITNKTLEGYPGARFHGGGRYVDVIEQTGIDRACELFDCTYANVQPHSGSQANLAVFFALLKPGDKVLSLDLAAGGHLSHGLSANLSGHWFQAHHYGVQKESGTIDYDAVEARAKEVQPQLLITGGSAYPRTLDFERLGAIAKQVGALFLADMAHIAGLVAGGVHTSPLPHADIVTCTTTKTLRGPRGGLILSNSEDWKKKLQSAVFPGVQGSLHTQILAAKSVCLGEALHPSFREYAQQIVVNAKTLAATLQTEGVDIVSGGTDTHIVLLDLSGNKLSGKEAEEILDQANITSNKNPVPFDVSNPNNWSGLRLGVAAATTRGFTQTEFEQLGRTIASLLTCKHDERSRHTTEARTVVERLCKDFPIYSR